MAKVYADLICKGLKTYSQVPDKIKDAVRDELIARGREDLLED